MRRAAMVSLVLACGACNGGGGTVHSPTPAPTSLAAEIFRVPSGYASFAWGTPKEAVLAKYPDLKPAKKPEILAHETTLRGKRVKEAFFFGAKGLEQAEVRYEEKLSPHESADLAMEMDAKFGVHETSHADDHLYQLAWIGEDTEVRLTYDLRESVSFGPVVTWSVRKQAATPSPGPDPGGTPGSVEGATPGVRFGNAIRQARKQGLQLASASASASEGRLALVYGDATRAVEILLTADPRTGAILDEARLTRSSAKGLQRSAGAVIDKLLESGEVTRVTFGGKPGFEKMVTLYIGKGWIQLDPSAPNIAAGSSLNAP